LTNDEGPWSVDLAETRGSRALGYRVNGRESVARSLDKVSKRQQKKKKIKKSKIHFITYR
jgi:hypothetical protein